MLKPLSGFVVALVVALTAACQGGEPEHPAASGDGGSSSSGASSGAGTGAVSASAGSNTVPVGPICSTPVVAGVEQLATFATKFFQGAALDGTDLYFASAHYDGNDISIIERADLAAPRGTPISGEPMAWLNQLWSGRGYSHSVFLHGTDLFWVQDPGDASGRMPGPVAKWSLLRVAKAGGAAETVLTGVRQAAAITTGIVVERDDFKIQLLPWDASEPTDICTAPVQVDFVANDERVAWVRFGGVESCPIAGGPVETILPREDLPNHVELDVTHIYWLAGPVFRTPFEAPAAEPVVDGPTVLFALDDRDIYWSDATRVMRSPKSGGAATELVGGQTVAFYLAVDPTYVYWAIDEGSHCCVMRKLK